MVIETPPLINNFIIFTKEPFKVDDQVWVFINGILSFVNEDLILDSSNYSIRIKNDSYIDWDNDEIAIFYEPVNDSILDYLLIYG